MPKPIRVLAILLVILGTVPSAAALFSATLPTSRSSQVGTATTFFGSVINSQATALSGCAVSLVTPIDAQFSYQTTDPATNTPVGTANTPAELAGNGSLSYLLTLTANSVIEPTDVAFDFSCDSVASAPSFAGLNTLLFSASTTPTPDVIGLVGTLRNDGTVHLKATGELGVFSLASVNVGSAGTVVVTPRPTGTTLSTLLICETNPNTGACLADPAASVTSSIAALATSTFGVFAGSNQEIAFDPANTRIVVEFIDNGVVRGSTSVAVEASPNQAPIALATALPPSGPAPLAVAFDGQGSSDADGTISDYSWSFGDGTTATGATAAHTFDSAGTFTVTLTVTDNNGAIGSTTLEVTADAPPPPTNIAPTAVASATANQGNAPVTIVFDSAGSSDSDGSIVGTLWDFGDGSTATDAAPTHIFENPGTYNVSLVVTDNNGALGSRVLTIEVTGEGNSAPAAIASASALSGTAPVTINFSAEASSDSDGDITQFDWNFGDNTTASGSPLSKTFDTAGNFNVVLTVTDNDGAQSSTTLQISVAESAGVSESSLHQAAFVPGSSNYQFGFNSIPNIPIIDAPADTDFERCAMLHDGSTYRLYCFRQQSADTFYQFGFNASLQAYQFGFSSIPVLRLTGAPLDADASRFAMLHDGDAYRLYLPSKTAQGQLYQFSFNSQTSNYEYGFNSIDVLQVTGAPADTDFTRIAMLHDGSDYRFYAARSGSNDRFYQFAFNPSSSEYEFGFNNSIPELQLTNTPAGVAGGDFVMLHDGSAYRFYFEQPGPAQPVVASLNQAAFNRDTLNYEFGFNSIPNIEVTGAPADTDLTRGAMLHDGLDYRLYYFRKGSNDTFYQFGFNPATSAYEWGYRSIPVLTLTGAPAEADASTFAMLHDGSVYRLYLRDDSVPGRVHQFGFNPATQNYEYGFSSIPAIDVTGAPEDSDYDRWGMLHDGVTFRMYMFQQGSSGHFYQFGFNASTSAYEFGFDSISELDIAGQPDNTAFNTVQMLHDGIDYRLYQTNALDNASANEVPEAEAVADIVSGTEPLTVMLSATGSIDTDGEIASYFWDFGDGTTAAGESVSHTYQSAGSYTVVLTVRDGGGDSSTVQLTIVVEGAVGVTPPNSLHQAAFVSGTTTYEFGHNSIPNIEITGAPADTDFDRCAMLHDALDYRLYCFAQQSLDTFYQFAFNTGTQAYEYGFNSIATLKLTGRPLDADAGRFAMLHDGIDYRLYLRSKVDPTKLYQFAFNSATSDYEFGFNSIPELTITGMPADADFSRFGMLHDNSDYRLYSAKAGSNDTIYQYAFNTSSQNYEFGLNSIAELTLTNIPAGAEGRDFAMLYDGVDYRLYAEQVGPNQPQIASLDQAAFNSASEDYEFGFNSIPNIAVSGAPIDTDFERGAMLHDGSTYRLYYFQAGSNDTIYQFGFNTASQEYEFGHNSIPTLKLTGIPAEASSERFAILHDGADYRLYLQDSTVAGRIHQFAFNITSGDYEYGFNSIAAIDASNVPVDADFSRWAMLHDGNDYRLYVFKSGSATDFYQAAFNTGNSTYEFGFASIAELQLSGQPDASAFNDPAMLHDGSDYRLYQTRTLGNGAAATTGDPVTPNTTGNNVIVLMGYWPPTNEMLRQWSTKPAQNGGSWQGENWEGLGYDIHAFFPEFPPDGDPSNNSIGDLGAVGSAESDLRVDYQDTSEDFWRITTDLNPALLVTTSRGGGIGWEIEAVEGGHSGGTTNPAQDWISDGFGSETLPTESSIDARSWNAISTYRNGNQLPSQLPINNIRAAAEALGLVSVQIDQNTSGNFLSGFLGLHGLAYNAETQANLAAGHIHVGGAVSNANAQTLMEETLRALIATHPIQ